MRFVESGLSLSEIEKLSILQFKKYADAVNRKRISDYIVKAKIARVTGATEKSYQKFISSLERCKKSGRPVTDKEMRDMGFAKKSKKKE